MEPLIITFTTEGEGGYVFTPFCPSVCLSHGTFTHYYANFRIYSCQTNILILFAKEQCGQSLLKGTKKQ